MRHLTAHAAAARPRRRSTRRAPTPRSTEPEYLPTFFAADADAPAPAFLRVSETVSVPSTRTVGSTAAPHSHTSSMLQAQEPVCPSP
mgnify:CR=1 FL=1